jgi:O-methyltransferase involved in polyketide biosynthesis
VSPSESISPTAHYTGFVWARHGLSNPELQTVEGRVLFESLRPMMAVTSATRGISLEGYLLARHLAIDALLERAIERGEVSQVVEIAAGLSPRGWRFVNRYQDRVTYIETDLPAMAARKRRALERIGSLGDRHRVEEIDALRDDGPGSLADLAAGLDRGRGLAIITEGLLGYLDDAAVAGVWRRFATVLSTFRSGRYISDIHLGEVHQTALVQTFRVLLSVFVRGRVHLHFSDAAEAEQALLASGFGTAKVRPAAEVARTVTETGSHLAHILEASTLWRAAA